MSIIEAKLKQFEEAVICKQYQPEDLALLEEIETDYQKSKKELLNLFNHKSLRM